MASPQVKVGTSEEISTDGPGARRGGHGVVPVPAARGDPHREVRLHLLPAARVVVPLQVNVVHLRQISASWQSNSSSKIFTKIFPTSIIEQFRSRVLTTSLFSWSTGREYKKAASFTVLL